MLATGEIPLRTASEMPILGAFSFIKYRKETPDVCIPHGLANVSRTVDSTL